MRIGRFETAGLTCKLMFNCIRYVVAQKASQLFFKKPKSYGIKKYLALKYSPLILKLQVTFTKR